MDKIISQRYKELYKKQAKRIIAAIKRYDRIIVFRHIMPDYDALGTQMGLATWIKDNFKNKEVHVVGDNHVTFTPRIYPVMDTLNNEWFKEPFLAIVVDVGNHNRIADPRYRKAKFKVKIDHHPETEVFAKASITDTSAAAAAEIVVNILLNEKNTKMSKEAASYFYTALVGDSGRFQYSSTTSHTFAIAQELLNADIDISEIYQKMYVKKIEDLQVTAYILNNFKVSPKGVAYYVLDWDTCQRLDITTERGKENVNLFSNIEGIGAWASITEDPKDNCWRVSLRSKKEDISVVANKFEGGGHKQASGCKLNSLNDLPRLIEELDKLF